MQTLPPPRPASAPPHFPPPIGEVPQVHRPRSSRAVVGQALSVPLPAGQAVNWKLHQSTGTKLHKSLAYGAAAVVGAVALVLTFGAILLFIGLGWLVSYFLRRRYEAAIEGSCLRVSERQLPEIQAAVTTLAGRLGMTRVPPVYIYETSSINAFAMKIGGRNKILLTDDLVDACCLHGNDPATLNYILAHELSHHVAGHTSALRTALTAYWKPLSRLDELTADNIARALVNNRDVTIDALITILSGPQLLPYVDRAEVINQAMRVAENKRTKKVEKTMSHPLLLRRIANAVYGEA